MIKIKKNRFKWVFILCVIIIAFSFQYLYTYNWSKDSLEEIFEKIYTTPVYTTSFSAVEKLIPEGLTEDNLYINKERYSYRMNNSELSFEIYPETGEIREMSYTNDDHVNMLELDKLYGKINLKFNNFMNIKKQLGNPVSRSKFNKWDKRKKYTEKMVWRSIDDQQIVIYFQNGYPISKEYQFEEEFRSEGKFSTKKKEKN